MRIDAYEFGRITIDDLREEARRRGVEVLLKSTPELVKLINEGLPADTSVILHVTC